MDLLIHSAFIRAGKQRERKREREGVGGAFIRSVSIRFQEALPEIRLECVVIPPGSPLYPASFTMLPSLSLSTHARINDSDKTASGLRLMPSCGRDGNSKLPKINN